MEHDGKKRSRSRSPPPWRRPPKYLRADYDTTRPATKRDIRGDYRNSVHSGQQTSVRDQTRLNQMQEDERMRQWVAQEDDFVLKQRKKKAEIRVKEHRAQPIDWLAVLLRFFESDRDLLDYDVEDCELEIIEPDRVFEGLSIDQLSELEKDIETFLHLEKGQRNQKYWRVSISTDIILQLTWVKELLVVGRDFRTKLGSSVPEGRAVRSVASDIDRLLEPKSYEELEILESQIARKLKSNEPIDTDYWEQLLKSLQVWKAKASLKLTYQSIEEARFRILKSKQAEEAAKLVATLTPVAVQQKASSGQVRYSSNFDPKAMLQLRMEDKTSDALDEDAFLRTVADERRLIGGKGPTTTGRNVQKRDSIIPSSERIDAIQTSVTSRFAAVPAEDFSQATKALYEREVARGISENEEVFTGEEDVYTKSKPNWAAKHRPRKPRYFNRVQMGYEWNKYNQTHYDHDNPPPKVVQGYKFNIFYPDLIDKSIAPTYKIEREGGRKRGQSFAPAGEEDTCLIRFISGPPYEDIAFRIVDKEWDYSAKRERGFKSSFDKVGFLLDADSGE
ncbi:MAG: hypothetical protein Q9227_000055 [Pyrenula ochraceoflavens]